VIEYIEYKKRKYPFLISFSTLIKFEKQTGKDFLTLFAGTSNMIALAESLTLILKLGLETGFQAEKPNFLRQLFNLIRFRNKIGLKENDYLLIVDNQWQHLLDVIPKFFYDLRDNAASSVEDAGEEIIKDLDKKK